MGFNLDDCVELLLNARKEEFRHEFSIRLFQFQTWILYSSKRGVAARDAGRLAAAAILRSLEEKHKWRGVQAMGGSRSIWFDKLQSLASAPSYSDIFDEFISSAGGWSNLLFSTPGSTEFDNRIKSYSDGRIGEESYPEFVADLIHYRLRAACNLLEDPNRSGIIHAVFFKWRQNPTTFTTRTAWKWWKKFHRTAAFMYLIYKRRFPMMVPDVDDDDFVKHLTHPIISKAQLKTFFAEYQFIADILGDAEFYVLPEPVTPARFKVKRFSTEELAIINAYDPNEMNVAKRELELLRVDKASHA
jgi:hypothetical protein